VSVTEDVQCCDVACATLMASTRLPVASEEELVCTNRVLTKIEWEKKEFLGCCFNALASSLQTRKSWVAESDEYLSVMAKLALKSVAKALMGLFKSKSSRLVSNPLAAACCRLAKWLGDANGVDDSEEVTRSIICSCRLNVEGLRVVKDVKGAQQMCTCAVWERSTTSTGSMEGDGGHVKGGSEGRNEVDKCASPCKNARAPT